MVVFVTRIAGRKTSNRKGPRESLQKTQLPEVRVRNSHKHFGPTVGIVIELKQYIIDAEIEGGWGVLP